LSPRSPLRRVAASITARIKTQARWLAQHQVLCLILFSSFVTRLFLAPSKSYWYDEILSVAVYGSNHLTLASALNSLAVHSAHPPLYHVVLFYWMQLFGTGEVATRTLSNLYITGATLLLYLLTLRLFSRRVAIASALLFAFSYTTTYFGLEVRSYAQSLFLVTLSSLLFLRWIEGVKVYPLWRDFFTGQAVALMLCNIALLLTHYSNALFVIVQAVFVSVFFAHRARPGARLMGLPQLAAFYAMQLAIAFAIWGPVALTTRDRFGSTAKYALHGFPQETPPEIFLQSVLRPSFIGVPRVIVLAVLVCVGIVVLRSAKQHFLSANTTPPLNQYFLFYLVAWTALPSLLAYAVYFAAGFERYFARYFSICIPPFVVLFVLALEQFVALLGLACRKSSAIRRHYLRNATLCALIACAIFALPGAYVAAEDPKGLYREIADSIVKLVEHEPKPRFAIYEAARRRQSLLNYYLERFSKDHQLRVDGTLWKDNAIKARIANRDFLIIAFPFDSVSKFPRLMASLQNGYSVTFSQFSDTGIGYIVFEARSAEGR
jgi:uncharacterized membrane protein